MKVRSLRLLAGFGVVLPLLLSCAGSASVVRTFDERDGQTFRNVLVIGVAADYDARAMFERGVASRIRATGGSATAYYTVVGRNPPIDRATVVNAVRSRHFDAVLLTRVRDQEVEASIKDAPAATEATVIGGGVFNVFRYDYEELNEPSIIDLSSTVVLSTELYDAVEERRIWAIETTSRNKSNIGELVDSSADAIVKQLRHDRLIGD